ncbi:hypothetical protein [Thalassovita aquimarina]|uniref:hypothetical protein n=1 Tax=Thalassovita aquimarina TaxID=2785917 RepID=UPI00356A9AD3
MFGKVQLKPLIIVMMLAALPAAADGVRDSVVSQLKQQGYQEITVSRTWLGRIRILARRDGERREIIVNPRTGEILRDFWASEDDSGPVILANPGPPSTGGDGPDGGGSDSGDDGGDSGHGDGGDDSGGDDGGGDSGGGDDGGGDADADSGGESGEGEGDSGGDSGGDDGPGGDD